MPDARAPAAAEIGTRRLRRRIASDVYVHDSWFFGSLPVGS
ncbi:hypothetical protein ACUN0C_10485 [Faunimonas sp. B44]